MTKTELEVQEWLQALSEKQDPDTRDFATSSLDYLEHVDCWEADEQSRMEDQLTEAREELARVNADLSHWQDSYSEARGECDRLEDENSELRLEVKALGP
jgi:predicted  nucleic acid-binding Zn-ribbon protein